MAWDLFPKAPIWIQKDKYNSYIEEDWQSNKTHGGIDLGWRW